MDLLGLPTGTRLHLGDTAMVKVTGLRNPWAQLDGIQRSLIGATLGRDGHDNLIRKAGVMGVILASGEDRLPTAEATVRAVRSQDKGSAHD